MKLFGQIVGAIVETVKLPVAVVKDVLAVADPFDNRPLGARTAEQLDEIKDAAKSGEGKTS